MSAPLLMLKELGTIHTGSTPKTNDESLFGGDVPFVTPGDLDSVSPIQSTPRTLTEAGVKTADLLPAESVLVCCIGSLGKSGFAGRPVVTNQQINAVVFNSAKVHARYGFFACRMLKPQLELMAPATTVPIVNKSRFSELRIPVPPLEEQRRIAAILDQAETLRTQRRQALAHLDTLTQSLFLDMFGDPVANDRGWLSSTLGGIAAAKPNNGVFRKNPEYVQAGLDGLPVVWVEELFRGDLIDTQSSRRLVPTVKELENYGLRFGDLLFCRSSLKLDGIAYNNVYLGASNEALFECHLIRVSPDLDRVSPIYMNHLLRLPMMRAAIKTRAKTSTMTTIDQQGLCAVSIVVPPLPLQQTFATRIQAIEALKTTHRAALAQLDALFASLQQWAFAGCVVR